MDTSIGAVQDILQDILHNCFASPTIPPPPTPLTLHHPIINRVIRLRFLIINAINYLSFIVSNISLYLKIESH